MGVVSSPKVRAQVEAVCGTDGKWRSLDAPVLYALGVVASER